MRVNGRTVTQPGTKADARRDRIEVDGQIVEAPAGLLYFLLHKPPGVVSTLNDPEGRPTVRDLLSAVRERVFPVGRLDYGSSGLLVLTNDGALTERLLHPRFQVPRTYRAKLAGVVAARALSELRHGVLLDDGSRAAPAAVRVLRTTPRKTWLELVLREGRNREVRRMCESLGYGVEKLLRVQYGPLSLDVPVGGYRPLKPKEIKQLKNLVANTPPRPRPSRTDQILFPPRREGEQVRTDILPRLCGLDQPGSGR